MRTRDIRARSVQRKSKPSNAPFGMIELSSVDEALVARIRGQQAAQVRLKVLRFAFGCAIGLVPAVWLWGSVLEIHLRDVAAVVFGDLEPPATESATTSPAVNLGMTREPSEEYKEMLRHSGVGLDPSRLKDAQAIARAAYPNGW